MGFCFFLLFFFVPETFWNRLPRPTKLQQHPDLFHHGQHPHHHLHLHHHHHHDDQAHAPPEISVASRTADVQSSGVNNAQQKSAFNKDGEPELHVGFSGTEKGQTSVGDREASDHQAGRNADMVAKKGSQEADVEKTAVSAAVNKEQVDLSDSPAEPTPREQYTEYYRSQPPKTVWQLLKPYSGRLSKDNWFKVALRPFILYAYPSVLWSAMVYSLSVGWLIVISESVAHIYRESDSYNFTALQTGLVYISPFIGGILGTAVAGKVSDVIVRYMSRKNDGVYEPEFRLVMGIPVALCTTIGLMGFGWSAEERNAWIVPTIFFGIISFGCTLGSTTAITFCVDSYRQYAGEALVTLNFSKSKSSPLLR